MPRLLFEKKDNAVWISHLDLMRLFQRAFKRAGLQLKHTQGFNPRPSVSIALPLSVGVESNCELLDFDLDGEPVSCDTICSRLNACLIRGVRVLKVYNDGRKYRDLSLLSCRITLEYDNGVADDCVENIRNLFSRESLLLSKKTKHGMEEQDIIPMIRKITVNREGNKGVVLDSLICCQNPTLNPNQLVAAICTYLPDYAPSFSRCVRMEIFDINETVFR